MAHKKGQGASRNGRDSVPKMRGVKRFGGELVAPATSSCRQIGTVVHPGELNVGLGRDSHHLRAHRRPGRVHGVQARAAPNRKPPPRSAGRAPPRPPLPSPRPPPLSSSRAARVLSPTRLHHAIHRRVRHRRPRRRRRQGHGHVPPRAVRPARRALGRRRRRRRQRHPRRRRAALDAARSALPKILQGRARRARRRPRQVRQAAPRT